MTAKTLPAFWNYFCRLAGHGCTRFSFTILRCNREIFTHAAFFSHRVTNVVSRTFIKIPFPSGFRAWRGSNNSFLAATAPFVQASNENSVNRINAERDVCTKLQYTHDASAVLFSISTRKIFRLVFESILTRQKKNCNTLSMLLMLDCSFFNERLTRKLQWQTTATSVNPTRLRFLVDSRRKKRSVV